MKTKTKMIKLSKFYWTKKERCDAYGLYTNTYKQIGWSFEKYMEYIYDGRFDN